MRWQWDGRDRWKLFEIEQAGRARVRRRSIPDHVLLLDVNYTNNSATLAPRARRRPRASGRWRGWSGCRTTCSPTGSSSDGRARLTARSGRASGASTARRWCSSGCSRVTLLVALPLSYRAARDDRGAPRTQPGRGRRRPRAANYDWWQEFSAQASGLGTTFVPSIIGFGAVLDNLSGLLDNQPLAATIAGVTAAWLVLWSFLTGGIIDRFARARPTRVARLLRRLRHALLALAPARRRRAGWSTRFLFALRARAGSSTRLYPWLTRDLTVERTAFAIRLGGYLRLRRAAGRRATSSSTTRASGSSSRTGAARSARCWPAARFVRRHAGTVAAFMLLNALLSCCSSRSTRWSAPGAPGSGLSMWLVLALGELYILGRHYLKLLFYASETAFFQGALAHAAYTAAPARGVAGFAGGRERSRNADRIGNPERRPITWHALAHLQERAHPDRRRRAGQCRSAAAAARARRLQPDREHERSA